jgi:hypothetical protein
MPDHHVTNDLLALSLHPLFRGPRGRNGDRQQQNRAEDRNGDILRRRPGRKGISSLAFGDRTPLRSRIPVSQDLRSGFLPHSTVV